MKISQKYAFPVELLRADIKERVDYFKGRMINHSMLSNAFNKAAAALDSTSGPQVVTLTGPTGVGKTTVARRIYKHLVDAYKDEVLADPSMVPVLGINAVPPNGAMFNWKDFYYRLLEKTETCCWTASSTCPPKPTCFRNWCSLPTPRVLQRMR